MIAKIWKKLLLAICIIAILFNITAKLVNRISLEKAISSSPEGIDLKEILNITNEETTTSSDYTNNVSRYKTVEEVEAEQEAMRQESEEPIEEASQEEPVQEEVEEPQEEKSTGSKIIDKVTESITDTKKYNNLLN